MNVEDQLNLKAGNRVLVHNKSRLDHAFEGRTGSVINPITSNGYVRLHLDGDQETMTVLVHPESIVKIA